MQPAAELRQVFKREILRVGTEGAIVVRTIGEKVEKMEKLSPGDLLEEVHKAAEELQMMVDQKSYHLVNCDKWPTRHKPKEFEEPDHFQELRENEHKHGAFNTLSEVTGNMRSVGLLRNLSLNIPPGIHLPSTQPTCIPHASTNTSVTPNLCKYNSIDHSSEDLLKHQKQWPSRLSVMGDVILNEREVRTYESASALSLVAFTSVLIEFVARLQNLVYSFEELSEKAKFRDPVASTTTN